MQYEFMGREVRADIFANLLDARNGVRSITYIHYFTWSSWQDLGRGKYSHFIGDIGFFSFHLSRYSCRLTYGNGIKNFFVLSKLPGGKMFISLTIQVKS